MDAIAIGLMLISAGILAYAAHYLTQESARLRSRVAEVDEYLVYCQQEILRTKNELRQIEKEAAAAYKAPCKTRRASTKK